MKAKKKYKNHNYLDLSPKIKKLFEQFGFKKIPNTAKPYYAATKQGKICRVIDKNKLKEMKDGASPTQYGYVKIKQTDGTYKEIGTHRLIAEFIDNPENKPVVNHKAIYRNHNKIDELEWCTQSENMRHYYEHKKRSE